MSGVYADRIARAARAAGDAGLDGLLVSPGADLRYLTGHAPPPLERLTLLVLAPGHDPVLLVPALEAPAAEDAPGASAVTIATWSDGDDPYEAAARLLPAGRYALSDDTWAAHVLGLQAARPAATLLPAGRTMPPLRIVKDTDELRSMISSAHAADAAFAQILGRPFAGRRERDVGAELADLLRAHGHDQVDFTIVGSGPNAASPHHTAGERTISRGDAVVLDFGGFADGYGSDITRTVVVGEAPDGFEDVYIVVRKAQQAAFDVVRPGIACEDVDAAARDVIRSAGYGDRFIHRTGHGIGLKTHEPPYLVTGDRTPLGVAMTFSIEPGIYLPGRFGVRIEDIVAVTADGARRLNQATRELQVVG